MRMLYLSMSTPMKINYIEAYCSLGILYIEIGELSRAAIMFRESLALEKDYVDSV
jgi:hypothetical protein